MTAEKIAGELSEAMKSLLCEICASNGGGVSALNRPERTWRALYNRGLIQGKKGQDWRMVHTPLGQQVRAILENDNAK